jgi:glutamate 5-kinase
MNPERSWEPISRKHAARDRAPLCRAQLLVVKLGTGVLSDPRGGLDLRRLRRLAKEVVWLHRRGRRVVIVSSGAIGAGMSRLGLRKRPAHIADLQACAAIGQNLLMSAYEHAFARQRLTVAQILLTHDDLRHPQRRENARHTIRNLLDRGVVPVINENDAVSYAEIKFGDNDQLAAMVHELIHAHACIILSNVDGFILPGASSDKRRATGILSTIAKITPEIERHAGDSNSHHSVGGMRSKLIAARRVLAAKRPMVIANGRIPDILPRLLRGEPIGTIFLPENRA